MANHNDKHEHQWHSDDFEQAFGRSGQGTGSEDTEHHTDEAKAEEKKEPKIKWHFSFGQKNSSDKSESAEPVRGKPRGKEVRQEKKPNMSPGRIFRLVLLIVIILILASGIYILPEGQIAFVTQFGKIVSSTSDAGLHYHLPLIQTANFLSSKIMFYDVSPSEALTADKKAMVVDSYALWKIDNAQLFMRTVGGNISEMEKRIDASVYSNIKNIVGGLPQSDIISDEASTRNTLNQQITNYVGEELSNYGVEVLRVEIRRYDLPTDNLSAVYNRMISERKQMAEAFLADGEYEAAKLRNQTDKESGIIIAEAEASARRLEGEAEAEYMEIIKQIYSDQDSAEFYRFMLELDALKASLAGDKTLILGPDSVLGQLLQPEKR